MKSDNYNESIENRNKEETFFDLRAFKLMPVSDRYINALAKRMIKWADSTKSNTITAFYNKEKIIKGTFYRWKARHEVLSLAHQYALQKISERREEGGLNKTLDSRFVQKSMPIYDIDYREHEKWLSSLKQEEERASGPQIVVVPEFPSTKMVPDKEKDDEVV